MGVQFTAHDPDTGLPVCESGNPDEADRIDLIERASRLESALKDVLDIIEAAEEA